MVVVEVAVVDDECIEIIAGFEAAYVSEERASGLSGQPEGFGQREEMLALIALVVHLAHLDGIDDHAEDAEVVTSADVAAQAYADASVEECANGCHAGSKVEVGRRAMGYHDIVLPDQFQLVAFGPDAMRHDGRCLSE